LKHIFPIAAAVTCDDADGVCLVKPQFEAGREKVGKKGVVREPQTHKEVIAAAMSYAVQNGFSTIGLDFSPIKGPEGNIEFLLHVQKSAVPEALSEDTISAVVEAAHSMLS
ncbi:MAG: TlyA family RNA methyltransferase, partial [Ruthenibacterium sp.]